MCSVIETWTVRNKDFRRKITNKMGFLSVTGKFNRSNHKTFEDIMKEPVETHYAVYLYLSITLQRSRRTN